jgi:hypothetical protein
MKKRFVGCMVALLLFGLLIPISPVAADPGLSTSNAANLADVEDLLASLIGAGITYNDVSYTGLIGSGAASLGSFTGGTEIIGFEDGIILSSGYVSDVVGPNSDDAISRNLGLLGDSDLDALVPPYNTYDATVLEFDFIPTGDTLLFSYVFGSEEYNEYVNSQFNDVFAFFLNGVNVALIPGTSIPVAINNVNNGNPFGTPPVSYPEYYRNNDPDDPGATIDTQMDGMTVVFSVNAPVNPGVENHIKLAIADTSDHILDSWVLIKAGSFTATDLVLTPFTETNNVGAEHILTATYTESGEPVEGATIHFEIIDGPHAGLYSDPDPVTDADGVATWSYVGSLNGMDTIQASVVGAEPEILSNEVTKTWEGEVNYEITATPSYELNPVKTDHLITATVTIENSDPVIYVEGITVCLEVVDGPNVGKTASGTTNANGQVDLTYFGDGGAGSDTIRVWVDKNGNGQYDDGEPFVEVIKDWVVNFITGGGTVKDGKKVAWTFAGTVGFLDDGQTTIVGQYQLFDHVNKVSWHCHNEFTYLHFKGTLASSPPAMFNIGTFTGNFTNKNRDWQVITIQITDKRESGKKGDTIKAKEGSFTDIDAAFASPWLFQADPISGGNLQVHNGYK